MQLSVQTALCAHTFISSRFFQNYNEYQRAQELVWKFDAFHRLKFPLMVSLMSLSSPGVRGDVGNGTPCSHGANCVLAPTHPWNELISCQGQVVTQYVILAWRSCGNEDLIRCITSTGLGVCFKAGSCQFIILIYFTEFLIPLTTNEG
jgi:predicted RNA-binding Zn-ribbon protein involved in translation (DUF1610 family)